METTEIMYTKKINQQFNGLKISWLEHIIQSLRPLLPIQNPIPFFVHNNPIQNWEKHNFQEGLEDAILTFENSGEHKSRVLWRELEDFILPIVISYFDQGLTRWNLQSQKTSLFDWYRLSVQSSLNIKSKFLPELKSNLSEIKKDLLLDAMIKTLEQRCTNQELWFTHLQALTLHFKGWSGMIQVLEKDSNLFPLIPQKVSLVEWMAILLFTENAINLQKEKPWWGKPLWNPELLEPKRKEIKMRLSHIYKNELNFYQNFISDFEKQIIAKTQQLQLNSPLQNNQFKNSNLKQDLTAIKSDTSTNKKNVLINILFCLDDREESLRRALEATNKSYETYGTLGFFGLDFSLKRPNHLIYQPYCPPVIQPRKKAEEINTIQNSYLKNLILKLIPYLNESRFSFLEPILTLILWPIYFLCLILRSLSPQIYSKIRSYFREDHYINNSSTIHFQDSYTKKEKAEIVAGILGGSGLIQIDSPLVIVMGHAATTTNNPFQKSYGCGACSGQSGFSNAKVFSDFANDIDVRDELKLIGIIIDPRVTFLAACHDTSQDEVIYDFKNKDLLSSVEDKDKDKDKDKEKTKLKLYEEFKLNMTQALKRNKQERWQQFQLPIFESAKSRGSDWSQPRPEFGHTGVSLAIFGPRWLTKEYDLNRKAFLMSYEPSLDENGENLSYVILNALPVCANINLDYYTSAAFPESFGAGSKLPLNIASGIGLMTGSKGDLRIGLATQMIDRHGPKRLLAFVYADKNKLENTISKSIRLQNIIKNNWIHLIRIDPQTLAFEFITNELKRNLNYDSKHSI